MDGNLKISLENIQQQIDTLNKQLSEAQNQKLTTEVHLQNEQQEMDSLKQQLELLTGLNDIKDVENYLNNKQVELNNIMQDLQNASACMDVDHTFTEDDVNALKNIIDKYNIPIVQ